MRFRSCRAGFGECSPGAFFVGLLFPGPPPAAGQSEPAEVAREVLAGLDLEAKVGQVLAPRAPAEFRHEGDPERRALLALAESGRIGGAVVFAGTPGGTREMTAALQSVAPLPLLIGADYEWGTAMRTAGGTRFPPAMQAAAAPDPESLERQGRIVAREARAVGVHLVLAPVLDVLRSPESAVIGTRSYGADPELVARLGAAFLRGVEAGGALATAKHFPGHGGTGTDSHYGLATVPASREHLEAVDLAPFRAAVEAGVSAVMPGHLAVPALDGRDDRPAILSPEILGGVLRSGMGFTGLVVSDALDMEGARAGRFDGEVAAAALAAGVDLILVPKDPVVAHQSLVRAVRAGRLPASRLDEAVLRVLEAKARLGLFRDRRPPGRLGETFGDPEDRAFAESLFSRGLTLLRDPEGLLPFSTRLTGDSSETPRLLLIELHRESPYEPDAAPSGTPCGGAGALLARIPTARHGAVPLERFTRDADRADAVVLADFRRYGLELPERCSPRSPPLRKNSWWCPSGTRTVSGSCPRRPRPSSPGTAPKPASGPPPGRSSARARRTAGSRFRSTGCRRAKAWRARPSGSSSGRSNPRRSA